MIVFVIKRDIQHVMNDYLQHITEYLQRRYNIIADILVSSNVIKLDHKYTHIIFVQQIDLGVVTKLRVEDTARKIYVLNTEQATVPSYTERLIRQIKQCNVPVIDYSMENIRLLRIRLPDTQFIHFPFPIMEKPLARSKDINVISLCNSPRRIQACRAIGMHIADFNRLWGKQRDTLIEKSKILVNIHHSLPNYNIFESIRCYHALELKTLIISEPSIDMESILLKDFIIFAAAGKFREKINEVLENYDSIYNNTFSDTRFIELQERLEQVYTKSLTDIGLI